MFAGSRLYVWNHERVIFEVRLQLLMIETNTCWFDDQASIGPIGLPWLFVGKIQVFPHLLMTNSPIFGDEFPMFDDPIPILDATYT